ncbi:Ca2+-binding RTX toxin-like protein [Bradyrhizobium sp. USDA 4518]
MSAVEINNLAYPFDTVVYIETTYPDGSVFTGSGVIVGPNDVLTASHVVYNGSHGGAASSIKVIPAYDPSPLEMPYGTFFASNFQYYIGFDPDNDGVLVSGNNGPGLAGSEIDFAVIGLNTAIGDRTGWMGIDPNFSSGIVNITGYPGFYGDNPMNDSGYISEDSTDFIYNYGSIEVHPGNSGGPVWHYLSNGFPYVVSVVSTSIWGAQLSGSNYDVLENWISANDFLIANADRLLSGTAGADHITSGGGNDTINALAGDDVITAGAGNDIVNGGDGNDTIHGQDGTDTINGENGNDVLYGETGNDILSGGAGNDYLDGGFGYDQMRGGLGNDTFVFNSGADVAIELAGQGIDTIMSSASLVMPANVENATLTGNGWISLTGTTGSNVLTGNPGNNVLLGGLGDDTLIGKLGKDTLTGGGGLDKMVLETLADSGTAFSKRDVINTFAHGDKIDVSAIDANTNVAGNQAFTFAANFTGVAGQLQWDLTNISSTGVKGYLVQGDVNGDAVADFSLQIYTAPTQHLPGGPSAWTLAAFDFVL